MYILAKIANNSEIQVWVQGEKIGGQWLFDDGSPIPGFCRISASNGSPEIHLRAKGTKTFICADNWYGAIHHYSCEYHRY